MRSTTNQWYVVVAAAGERGPVCPSARLLCAACGPLDLVPSPSCTCTWRPIDSQCKCTSVVRRSGGAGCGAVLPFPSLVLRGKLEESITGKPPPSAGQRVPDQRERRGCACTRCWLVQDLGSRSRGWRCHEGADIGVLGCCQVSWTLVVWSMNLRRALCIPRCAACSLETTGIYAAVHGYVVPPWALCAMTLAHPPIRPSSHPSFVLAFSSPLLGTSCSSGAPHHP